MARDGSAARPIDSILVGGRYELWIPIPAFGDHCMSVRLAVCRASLRTLASTFAFVTILTGCGTFPSAPEVGWVLVENPRFGTINAGPDERRYVWVLEDRVAGL